MSNTAEINVVLVNSTSNTFNVDQIQATQNAIDGLTGMPGNQQDANIAVSNNGMPDITAQGSIQSPILAVQVVADQPELSRSVRVAQRDGHAQLPI